MFDTSKIDEWTVEMCRDYLLMRMGCIGPDEEGDYVHVMTGTLYKGNPIQQTLCEAAKLPEGWVLRSLTATGPIERLQYTLNAAGPNCNFKSVFSESDELLARFRLRCLVESRPH